MVEGHQGKRLEAFCEKDSELICIDCILSEKHRGHEITSVAKAAERHRIFLRSETIERRKA